MHFYRQKQCDNRRFIVGMRSSEWTAQHLAISVLFVQFTEVLLKNFIYLVMIYFYLHCFGRIGKIEITY